jgi:hypothetical protein
VYEPEPLANNQYQFPWIPYPVDTAGRGALIFKAKYYTSDQSKYKWKIGQGFYSGREVALENFPSNYIAYPKLIVRLSPFCGDDGIDSMTQPIVIRSGKTKVAGTYEGFRNDGIFHRITIDTTIDNTRPLWQRLYSIYGLEDTCRTYITGSHFGWKQLVFSNPFYDNSEYDCGGARGRVRVTSNDSILFEYSLAKDRFSKPYTFHGKRVQ